MKYSNSFFPISSLNGIGFLSKFVFKVQLKSPTTEFKILSSLSMMSSSRKRFLSPGMFGTCIRYSTIETKDAARNGYNGFHFPHEYSGGG